MTPSGIVTVSALIPGHFYLPHKDVFQDALESGAMSGDTVPTFAFLIEHPSLGKYMFDLGLRKHAEGYPPAWNETLQELKPDCNEDVCDILLANHIQPSEIKGVIFSHLHFDHTGDVQPFVSAEIILGAEARSLFDKPYPDDPESLILAWPLGRSIRYLDFFSGISDSSKTNSGIRAEEDTSGSLPVHLSSSENSKASPPRLPGFDRVLDFFGDQSLYIIDAPGHFPGHLMVLARVANPMASELSPSIYVLLAGDCCHNRECYSPGTRLVSQENHDDIVVARETVSSLIRTAKEMPNVIVVLAHEKELEEEGMPLLPTSLNDWAARRSAERLSEEK
ncbi:hypothetical protein GYMLUDRAFT_172636 [Collybiopsis luxurians FD-317 M1]|uniref:Metallo-beta-lactamase domain-containing protein n=1 Tax=Collybiopsis luxurians FD-317 M1 TaxID=944289 RepID=A0A0D0B306_9AGAR|nr:hypothetical protein GYMLUDRAFT_172636 [Collybiopsis luxurians FD-317 M1]